MRDGDEKDIDADETAVPGGERRDAVPLTDVDRWAAFHADVSSARQDLERAFGERSGVPHPRLPIIGPGRA